MSGGPEMVSLSKRHLSKVLFSSETVFFQHQTQPLRERVLRLHDRVDSTGNLGWLAIGAYAASGWDGCIGQMFGAPGTLECSGQVFGIALSSLIFAY